MKTEHKIKKFDEYNFITEDSEETIESIELNSLTDILDNISFLRSGLSLKSKQEVSEELGVFIGELESWLTGFNRDNEILD